MRIYTVDYKAFHPYGKYTRFKKRVYASTKEKAIAVVQELRCSKDIIVIEVK